MKMSLMIFFLIGSRNDIIRSHSVIYTGMPNFEDGPGNIPEIMPQIHPEPDMHHESEMPPDIARVDVDDFLEEHGNLDRKRDEIDDKPTIH